MSPSEVERSVDDSMSLNTIVLVPSKSEGASKRSVPGRALAMTSIEVRRAPAGRGRTARMAPPSIGSTVVPESPTTVSREPGVCVDRSGTDL